MSPVTSTIMAPPTWRVVISMSQGLHAGVKGVLPEKRERCNCFDVTRGFSFSGGEENDAEGRDPLAAMVDRDVTTLVRAGIDLARARDFLTSVEQHFLPLSDPTRGARDGEEHREHRHRETHRLVDKASVEIHVGVKPPGNKVIIFKS